MARRRPRVSDHFICPCCGARVAAGAKFCRECGASDDSGWGEGSQVWDDDLPAGYAEDDEFEYDDFVRREFPEHAPQRSAHQLKSQLAMALAVAVSIALILWTVLRGW